MKKFYEAPSAEELEISSADILSESNIGGGIEIGGPDSDNSGADLGWDDTLLG